MQFNNALTKKNLGTKIPKALFPDLLPPTGEALLKNYAYSCQLSLNFSTCILCGGNWRFYRLCLNILLEGGIP